MNKKNGYFDNVKQKVNEKPPFKTLAYYTQNTNAKKKKNYIDNDNDNDNIKEPLYPERHVIYSFKFVYIRSNWSFFQSGQRDCIKGSTP